MSDTPRTDANAGWFVSGYGIIRSDGLFTDHDGPFVHANFARELERENAALREDKERLDFGQIMLTAFGLREHHVGVDLRAAIDAARKEAQP